MREGDGLLVVQDRGAAIADAIAVQHGVHGEFKVFGQQMELPPVIAAHDLLREHEAGAADVAAVAEPHARGAQES